jgi:hypothetical protein
MLATYHETIGLLCDELSVDGSIHKAPYGGEVTGKNPVDRSKLGWKWSIATDEAGTPFGRLTDQANHNDCVLLPATHDEVERHGLLGAVGTLHLDRGYDNPVVQRQVAALGNELDVAKHRLRGTTTGAKAPITLGKRWAVERTNSWLSNCRQLRRNTDRCTEHRRAQIAFVIAILLIVKLIDQGLRATG